VAGCAERATFDEENYPPGEPQYGGTLNVGTVSVTVSALSWDPADWTWKANHDTGMVREQLFAGDLSKSVRSGGEFPFIAEAYLPTEAIRGELAESWEWEDAADAGGTSARRRHVCG
jgi:peptide/nickel transport system substrate-binding protein